MSKPIVALVVVPLLLCAGCAPQPQTAPATSTRCDPGTPGCAPAPAAAPAGGTFDPRNTGGVVGGPY